MLSFLDSPAKKFAKKHGLERKGDAYRGRFDGHQIQVESGKSFDLTVWIQGRIPEALEISLTKVAPKERVKLWAENREMDPQYFEQYASIKAKSVIELKDWLNDRVKKALRELFWIGRGISIEGREVHYRKFGGIPGEEFLEQLAKAMVVTANRIGKP